MDIQHYFSWKFLDIGHFMLEISLQLFDIIIWHLTIDNGYWVYYLGHWTLENFNNLTLTFEIGHFYVGYWILNLKLLGYQPITQVIYSWWPNPNASYRKWGNSLILKISLYLRKINMDLYENSNLSSSGINQLPQATLGDLPQIAPLDHGEKLQFPRSPYISAKST